MYFYRTVDAATGVTTNEPFSTADDKIMKANIAAAQAELAKIATTAAAKAALLERLGITADEAALLLS